MSSKTISPSNLANVSGAYDPQTSVIQSSNKQFNWKHADQAYVNPIKHKTIQLSPQTPVSSSFFNTANNWIDFWYPSSIDTIEDNYIMVTLANSSTTVANVNAVPPLFNFSRMELRVNDSIVQTLYPTEHLYIDQVVYHGGVNEMTIQEVNSDIDASTFDVNTTYDTTPISGNITYRIQIPSLLTKCGICLSTLDQKVVLRCYSNTYNFSSGSASTETVQDMLMYVQYAQASNSSIVQRLKSQSLDYRFVDCLLEQASVTLTAGTKTTYICQNFDDTMLASSVFVYFRTANDTIAFQSVLNNIWFQDSSGSSYDGTGIEWSATHLLNKTYPDVYENMLSQKKPIYVALLGSGNAKEDYLKGSVSGYIQLGRAMKLNINASVSGTYQMTICANIYKHVRVANSKLTVFGASN